MKIENVLNCSFDRWYENFKHVTFQSEIIPITDEVLAYLKSDSTIILPKSCQEALDSDLNNNKSDFSDDDSTDWDTEEPAEDYPDFPEFDEKINEALNKFRNKVFIKLNWSSPKDAYWALNKLSCDRLSDVYIQLRSSDFINHDLTEPFSDCEDKETAQAKEFQYMLILRDWININSSMEFRCFVHHNILVGVSQRDCRSFYQVLLDNKQDILDRIKSFYSSHIHKQFPDSSFIFDVCSGKKTIKLMDFNPFGKTTDTLLYSWDEFDELAGSEDSVFSKQLELRVIESNYGISAHQYSMYSQPKESLEAFLTGKQTESEADNLADMISKNIDIQNKEDSTKQLDDSVE